MKMYAFQLQTYATCSSPFVHTAPSASPSLWHQHCIRQKLCSSCKTSPCHLVHKKQLRQGVMSKSNRGGGGSEDIWRQLGSMADKYLAGTNQTLAARQDPLPVQGVHVLLVSLVLVWVLSSHSSPVSAVKLLALEHNPAKWWSPLTDAFCSYSGQHLARNLFFGYMFGRVVQNTESNSALWVSYLLSAAGGSCAALLLLPQKASILGCGSSGAMFGLFAMATLFNRNKQWHWQRWFELMALLPFVCQQLLAGHPGINQLYVLYGKQLGASVPLLGGLIGAAASAALLKLARLLQLALQQQQQQHGSSLGGTGATSKGRQQQQQPAADDPLQLLLKTAMAQLLKRVL